MLNLMMQSTVGDVLAALNELEFTQVPFALARTLTQVAHEGRVEVVAEMPDRFTLRSPRVAKGVRVLAAKKNDLNAAVYTMDWFMEDQESGGTRRAKKGGHMWVPTLDARAGGVFAGRVLTKNLPKNIRKQIEKGRRSKRKRPGHGTYAKPKAFIVGRNVYIRQDERRLPIVRLYTLADRAVLPPRWRFEKTMERVSAKHLRRKFIENLDAALKTKKGGPVKSAYVEHLMEYDGIGVGDAVPITPTFAQTLTQNG